MSKVPIILAPLLLTATVTEAQSNPEFLFVNERPADEDRNRFLSTFAGSCSFSIRVLSDEGRVRDRVSALEVALRSALGKQLDGHKIQLRSYQVYFNNGARQRDLVDAVVAGSRGNTVIGGRTLVPLCSQEKTPDGWFDPSELSNANPPIVTEIEAMLDGRPLSIRSVYSPTKALSVPPTAFSSAAKKNFADPKTGPEVDAAIDKANAAFVAQVIALMK